MSTKGVCCPFLSAGVCVTCTFLLIFSYSLTLSPDYEPPLITRQTLDRMYAADYAERKAHFEKMFCGEVVIGKGVLDRAVAESSAMKMR